MKIFNRIIVLFFIVFILTSLQTPLMCNGVENSVKSGVIVRGLQEVATESRSYGVENSVKSDVLAQGVINLDVPYQPPGNENNVFLLIKAGGKEKLDSLLKKEPALLEHRDIQGRTPLHIACEAGNKDIAGLLTEKGANVRARDMNDLTPLHYAAVSGDKKLMDLLLAKGVEINARDKSNKTPAMLAEEKGNREASNYLRFWKINRLIGKLSDIAWGPVTILLLLGAGIYFTVILKFLQFRAFPHAIELISGKYDDPEHKGEVSHFQALSAALSATVGTGNIAGVATAIALGGPGAVFWMWMVAVVGMLLKYSESLLAQKFRVINEDGTVSGGPMYYLEKGLGQKTMGVIFAIFTVIASFGIGNMVQANSVAAPLSELLAPKGASPEFLTGIKWTIGLILAVLTAAVIIGGIKRIGSFSSKIVPFMCVIYVAGAMYILLTNFHSLGEALQLILKSAFTPVSAVGGFAGSTVLFTIRMGVARALFSSEAGLGSSPIAHSAARTDEPVREGLVAMLEPFIDTIVICSMTALVIISTGVWNNGQTSSPLTVTAFKTGIKAAPMIGEYIVTFGLIFFAFSTLVSWSYYGDRSAQYLLGQKAVNAYRWIYVCLIPIGAGMKMDMVWNISDIFNALMAFPNLIGILGLSGVVLAMTNDYFKRKPEFEKKLRNKQKNME